MTVKSKDYTLSILMPVKNAAFFLPFSIRNIEENVSANQEIIVVDDASTDGTNEILRNWASKNSSVRIVKGPGTGIANALMSGLKLCSSDWVARFDVDDQYSPNRIQSQLVSIRPDSVAIFSDYKFQSMRGSYSGIIPSAVFPLQTKISLIGARRTPHPVAMFNREAALSVGGYRTDDNFVEDLSLWMRLSDVGELTSVPATHLNYRLTKKSITSSNQTKMKLSRDKLVTNFIHQKFTFEDFAETLYNLEDIYSTQSMPRCRIIHSLLEYGIYFKKIQEQKTSQETNWILKKLRNPIYAQELIKYFTFAGVRKYHRLFG